MVAAGPPVPAPSSDPASGGRVFVAHHDGPFSFPDGEVVASERIPLAEVLAWIRSRPHCPDSVVFAGPVIDALTQD